ncbi:hypothetical protein DFQ28_008010 [Apophysomyces sp. BC1034]|nr:hypothetical protein DFQ30_007270 [Apophysomyces sp. BC1015]KAG0182059.1 hypothetical protein DFQ29_005900 [Apophysomyces sp. BC1021]KAG0192766.1 hypothetical protein DFQ28_008010 [Apophysomyces sp. BC1034]
MVPKKPKSKRVKAAHRYKIQKFVKDHNKKQKKLAKKNPQHKKAHKDPGIPNSWPFKEELLNEIERQKQEVEEQKQKQKEARRLERAKKKQQQ